MAKKETKKAEKAKAKKGKEAATAAVPPTMSTPGGVPPTMSTPGGAPGATTMAGAPGATTMAGAPGATTMAGAPGATTMAGGQIPLSTMSPDQMTAAQLEQAIKESNDPNNRLKKLRSPINVRSCLLNLLILIVLTFAVVLLWTYLAVDKFDFGTVMSDMMEQFKITKFFSNIGKTISGWFS